MRGFREGNRGPQVINREKELGEKTGMEVRISEIILKPETIESLRNIRRETIAKTCNNRKSEI